MLNIAVVGAGNIAQRHLKVLTDLREGRVTTLVDNNPRVLEETGARFGVSKRLSSHEDLLEGDRPDAVFVLVSVLQVARSPQTSFGPVSRPFWKSLPVSIRPRPVRWPIWRERGYAGDGGRQSAVLFHASQGQGAAARIRSGTKRHSGRPRGYPAGPEKPEISGRGHETLERGKRHPRAGPAAILRGDVASVRTMHRTVEGPCRTAVRRC